MTRGRDADRGSASVWVLLIVLVVVAGSGVVALLGTAALARHRASTAADAAALAAAAHLLELPEAACAAARRLAVANGAALVRCDVVGDSVTTRVRLQPAGWLHRFGAATGVARAGQVVGGQTRANLP